MTQPTITNRWSELNPQILSHISRLMDHSKYIAMRRFSAVRISVPNFRTLEGFQRLKFLASLPYREFGVGLFGSNGSEDESRQVFSISATILMASILRMLLSMFWYAGAVALLRIFVFSDEPLAVESLDRGVRVIFVIVLSIPLNFIPAIWSWQLFIDGMGHKPRAKFLITSAHVAFLIFITLALLLSATEVEGFHSSYINQQNWAFAAAVTLLIALPSLTILYLAAMDIVWVMIKSVVIAIGVSGVFVRQLLEVASLKNIETFLTNPVPTRDANVEFHLRDLSSDERKTILEWASANLYSSELRLIVVSIIAGSLIAVLAVLIADRSVQLAIWNFIRWFFDYAQDGSSSVSADPTVLEAFGSLLLAAIQTSIALGIRLLAVIPVMMLVLLISERTISLLQNVVSQSLLKEACIIVEHEIRAEIIRQNQNGPNFLVRAIRSLRDLVLGIA